MFKGGEDISFKAPLLTSGFSTQSRIIPSLIAIKLKLVSTVVLWFICPFVHPFWTLTISWLLQVKGPWGLHTVSPGTTTGTFALHLTDLTLNVKRIRPKESLLNKIESTLNHSKIAKFYYENRVTRSFYLASGRNSFRLESVLHTNYLPSYCLLGFLDCEFVSACVRACVRACM